MNNNSQFAKGFTLLELLMVVGIITIIAVGIILTLNPAELLRQSRDAARLSDLSTLKRAITFYMNDTTTPNLGSYTTCYLSATTGNATSSARCGLFANVAIVTTSTKTSVDYRDVDGTGWIPVNFTGISSRSPLGTLPVDPLNNATYYYAYAASSSLTFELDAARLESAKYTSGAKDVVSTDGGDNDTAYESGTAPGLRL